MELSVNEAERLAELVRYDLLDTEAEEVFDRFTRLTAQIFDAPIALISLIDSGRQWFKSSHGLDASETPREYSFCSHAIQHTEVFIVPDATQDDRFATNPYVTGDPSVRFYAGAPLTTPAHFNLGTLCIVDTKPRPPLDENKQRALSDLAYLVMHEMESRRALARIRLTR